MKKKTTYRITPELINLNFPVHSIKRLSLGVEVIRSSRLASRRSESACGKNVARGAISYLSRRSLARLAFLARVTTVKFSSLLTLTYGKPFPTDGSVVKADLNKVLTHLREKYEGISYLWFMEFQARGAPHFHICLSVIPSEVDRFNMANYWSRLVAKRSIWSSFYPYHVREKMRRNMYLQHSKVEHWDEFKTPDGLARYITKYACKPEQKKVPPEYQNVGRFWGTSRDVKVPDVSPEPITDSELRDWLRDMGHQVADWEVLPKYIFLTKPKKET